ncbi:MAG: PTPA-CTERM sorting domain-containing protein [Synechococcales bacterium]|nr:PTPA-CTERM sorting domain-containing protein [Synechococcales bacterium]
MQYLWELDLIAIELQGDSYHSSLLLGVTISMKLKLQLIHTAIGCSICFGFVMPSYAATISHAPTDASPAVVTSPPFGQLASGGTVGTSFINFGVDYTYGGVEGIFNDPPLAFGGVNASNILDLRSPIDGRIVLPGTTTQGLTSLISVNAGSSDLGTLLLEAFDIGGNLLASAINSQSGVSTMTIDRSGVFDIAFFKVSTNGDTFGVQQVTLEQPISNAIPTPALLPGLIGLGVGVMRKRKGQAA